MNLLPFIENSHLLVYSYRIEKIPEFVSLFRSLAYVEVMLPRVTQHSRPDSAVRAECCWFACVINPVTLLTDPCQNDSFQKLLQKDLNSFVPCHRNVCSSLSTPPHLAVFQPNICYSILSSSCLFSALFFSPDVHFMCKAKVTISRVHCHCSALLLDHIS